MVNHPTDGVSNSSPVEKRKRQPPKRYIDESGGHSYGVSLTHPLMIDDEDLPKDTAPINDPMDADWTKNDDLNSPTNAKKPRSRRPNYMFLTDEKLLDEVEKLKEQISTSEATRKRHYDRSNVLREELYKETESRKHYRGKYVEALQVIAGLRTEISHEKKSSAESLARLEAQFEKVKRESLDKNKQKCEVTMPDNVIRDRFRTLLVKGKEWAKEWYRVDFVEELVEPLTARFLNYATDPQSSIRELLSQKICSLGSRAVRILVHATVTRTLLTRLFANPFWLFEAILSGKTETSNFRKLIDELSKDSMEETLHWRAQTNRLLRSDLFKTADRSGKNVFLEPLGRFCARQCITNMRGDLLREMDAAESAKCQQELTQIFVDASHLSLELFCQKSVIKLYGERELRTSRFTVKSDLFEPHNCMGLDSEDSSNIFEGKEIHFVLNPAVIARGNAQGQHLDESKVWSPAVVLNFIELLPDHDATDDEGTTSCDTFLQTRPSSDISPEGPLSKRPKTSHNNLAPNELPRDVVKVGERKLHKCVATVSLARHGNLVDTRSDQSEVEVGSHNSGECSATGMHSCENTLKNTNSSQNDLQKTSQLECMKLHNYTEHQAVSGNHSSNVQYHSDDAVSKQNTSSAKEQPESTPPAERKETVQSSTAESECKPTYEVIDLEANDNLAS